MKDHGKHLIPEIEAMAARVAAVQIERGLSAEGLIRAFPDLGSSKSWTHRVLAKDYEHMDLPRWHWRLTRICAILDGGSPEAQFFPEMPFARKLRARLTELEKAGNDRRILVVLAPTGVGKTSTARWLVAARAEERALLRCRPSWRNKLGHLSAGMLDALDETPPSTAPAALEDALVKALTRAPRTVFVDQAHEGGVALMHLLRCLVDETPSRFVYLAYPTAYKAVLHGSSDAMTEAKAFLGRCRKPVFDAYAHGVGVEDVTVWLREAAGLAESAAKSLAAQLAPLAAGLHNLRLLEDALDRAELCENPKAGATRADKLLHYARSLIGHAPTAAPTASAEEEA